MDELAQIANQMDRNGYTMAGRSLTKHGTGARSGNSAFPAPKGNSVNINRQARDIADAILTHPQVRSKIRTGKPGEVVLQVFRPDGAGIVFKWKNDRWEFNFFCRKSILNND
jgi:hypothetical protein